MTRLSEQLKNEERNYTTRSLVEILENLVVWLLFVVIACVACLTACQKTINPPVEQRVFFMDEVFCRKDPKGRMIVVTPAGDLWDFLVVGQGAWAEDQELLNQCEAQGVIKRNHKK